VRADRAALIARLEGVSIKLVRSVNDQGALYGAVTHRDIADQLVADGFHVDMRAVRLGQTIRRIGSYSCAIVFDRELRTEIGVEVAPDRTLELYARTEEPAAEEAPAEDEASEAAAPAAEGKGKAKAAVAKKAPARAKASTKSAKSAKSAKARPAASAKGKNKAAARRRGR